MNTESAKLVTFCLGDDHFAADIFSVERVLRYQAPRPVPDMPTWIQGVIEYRSHVVPVIDLRGRFELPRVPVRPATRILVFDTGGEWIGTVVDAVMEVATFSAGQLSPPPTFFRGLAGEYLKGIIRSEDRLLIVLDAGRLLSATERLALQPETAGAAEGA